MLWYGNPESSLLKSYKNTWFCSSVIEVDENGMAKAKYCKNRWCPVCQRNKMGAMINQYGPRLEREEELWFLTLTRQNVRADKLKHEILKYQELWNLIKNSLPYRKAMKRGVIGIRKVECTYHGQQFLKDGSPDPWYDTYHAHNHLLISDKELAEFIIREWKRQVLHKADSEGRFRQAVLRCSPHGRYLPSHAGQESVLQTWDCQGMGMRGSDGGR